MDNNEGLTSQTRRKAPQIVFIDTEVGIDSEKVHDYGAVRGDGAVLLHTQSTQVFALPLFLPQGKGRKSQKKWLEEFPPIHLLQHSAAKMKYRF